MSLAFDIRFCKCVMLKTLSVLLLCISLPHILEQWYITQLCLWFGLDDWLEVWYIQTNLTENNF